ncbi:MAG: hypothetical protein L0Z62_26620 [Gemmataceae bacterium]|nr:hypothetical protein [Gemmataceae bacterium]
MPWAKLPNGFRGPPFPVERARVAEARLLEMLEAYPDYRQHPEWWNPSMPRRDHFELVCRYIALSGDPVYTYVATAGEQGVSLLYHEATEMAWYYERGLDPFEQLERRRKDPRDGSENYRQAHSLGLIAEHRYLEKLALTDGKQFRLGELIRWNPVSARPEFDLRRLLRFVREPGATDVSPDDLLVRTELRQPVYAWYWDRGARGHYPREAQ